MSTLEGDFWVCGECRSINNARAKQCYNCRTPRDLAAVDPMTIEATGHGKLREIALPPFHSPKPFAAIASILILATAGLQVVQTVGVTTLLLQVLDNTEATPEQVAYIGIVGLVTLAVGATALVCWALWLSRAVTTMPALGLGYPAASGMMAFVENFLPGLNLLRVPAIVRDVVRRLEPGSTTNQSRGEALIFSAWIALLGGFVVPRVGAFLSGLSSDSTDSVIRSNLTIQGVSTGLVLVGAIFLVALIWWIEERIDRRREAQLAEIDAKAAGPTGDPSDGDDEPVAAPAAAAAAAAAAAVTAPASAPSAPATAPQAAAPATWSWAGTSASPLAASVASPTAQAAPESTGWVLPNAARAAAIAPAPPAAEPAPPAAEPAPPAAEPAVPEWPAQAAISAPVAEAPAHPDTPAVPLAAGWEREPIPSPDEADGNGPSRHRWADWQPGATSSTEERSDDAIMEHVADDMQAAADAAEPATTSGIEPAAIPDAATEPDVVATPPATQAASLETPSAETASPEPVAAAAAPEPQAAPPAAAADGRPHLTIRVSRMGMLQAEMAGETEHVILEDLPAYGNALANAGGTAEIIHSPRDPMAALIAKRAQSILADAGIEVGLPD